MLICEYCGRSEFMDTTKTTQKTTLIIFSILLISFLIYSLFSPLKSISTSEKSTAQNKQGGIQINNTHANIGSQMIQTNQNETVIQVNNTDATIHKQIIQKNKGMIKNIDLKIPENKTVRLLSHTQTITNSKGDVLYHKKETYSSPKDCFIDKDDIPHITLRTKEPIVRYSDNGLEIDNNNIAMSEQKISAYKKNGAKHSRVLSRNTEPAPLTERENRVCNVPLTK